MSQVFSVVVSLGFSEVPNLFRSHLEIFENMKEILKLYEM